MSEHLEQAALFHWAEIAKINNPEIELMYAIPNGGVRHIGTAIKLKKEGVKAGVPDICLPIARGGFHSLYIEMKYGKNKANKQQLLWMEKLKAQGHQCEVCIGWVEAKDIIRGYLDLKVPKDAPLTPLTSRPASLRGAGSSSPVTPGESKK